MFQLCFASCRNVMLILVPRSVDQAADIYQAAVTYLEMHRRCAYTSPSGPGFGAAVDFLRVF